MPASLFAPEAALGAVDLASLQNTLMLRYGLTAAACLIIALYQLIASCCCRSSGRGCTQSGLAAAMHCTLAASTLCFAVSSLAAYSQCPPAFLNPFNQKRRAWPIAGRFANRPAVKSRSQKPCVSVPERKPIEAFNLKVSWH